MKTANLTPTSWKQAKLNGRNVVWQAVAGTCEFCGCHTDDLYTMQKNVGGSVLTIAAHYRHTHVPVDFLVCHACGDKMLGLVNRDATHTYEQAVAAVACATLSPSAA